MSGRSLDHEPPINAAALIFRGNFMPVLVVMVALVAASIVYVYRFRGEARYESLTEYFRKGWPIFSPLQLRALHDDAAARIKGRPRPGRFPGTRPAAPELADHPR